MFLAILSQIQGWGLDGNIRGRGRFIRDDQSRMQEQSPDNHQMQLATAAGVGKAMHGVGMQAHNGQHGCHRCSCVA